MVAVCNIAIMLKLVPVFVVYATFLVISIALAMKSNSRVTELEKLLTNRDQYLVAFDQELKRIREGK